VPPEFKIDVAVELVSNRWMLGKILFLATGLRKDLKVDARDCYISVMLISNRPEALMTGPPR